MIGHPYDIVEEDVASPDSMGGDSQNVEIRVWALKEPDRITKKSEKFVIVIRGFRPKCYVELPPYFHPFGSSAKKAWTSSDAGRLVEEICKSARVNSSNVSCKLVKKSKLYYYQPNEKAFDMIEIVFDNNTDMGKIESTIENAAKTRSSDTVGGGGRGMSKQRGRFFGPFFGTMALRVWEGHKSVVTTTRQLMSLADVQYSQWCVFKPDCFLEKENDENMYKADCGIINLPLTSDLEVLKTKINQKFYACPPELIPKTPSAPSILAFDIETYSYRPNAFPNALNDDDKAYMISCVYHVHREDVSKRKRFLIHIEDALLSHDLEHPAYKSEEGMDNVEFIITDNEGAMVDALACLVDELDPDIVTGYNIHGFDYSYLDIRNRLTGNSITGEWPNEFTRSKLQLPKTRTTEWKSAAYGVVKTTTLEMEGRMSIDMMGFVKKNYTSLSLYNLKFVSNHFLPETSGKLDINHTEMFKFYKSSMGLYAKIKADGGANADAVKGSFVYKRTFNNMTKMAAYAIRDSEVVVDLFEKLNAWPGLVELSSVAGVTIRDTFGGQQKRVVSLLYDICSRENVILDSRATKKEYVPDGEEAVNPSKIKIKGGFVMKPTVGITDNVLCGDFQSLYPSIILAYNLCYQTLMVDSTPLEDKFYSGRIERFDAENTKVGQKVLSVDVNRLSDKRYDSSGVDDTPDNINRIDFINNLKEDDYEESEDDDGSGDDDCGGGPPAKEKKKSKKLLELESLYEYKREFNFRFVSKNVKLGVVPRLVARLLDSRRQVKRQMASAIAASKEAKKAGDLVTAKEQGLLAVVLEQRQLAYKMIANSTYGFLCAQESGKLPLIECAMAITAMGRQLILKVNDYVKTNYGAKIIYGDSVTGDTPLIVRHGGIVSTCRIDELDVGGGGSDGEWEQSYHGSKECMDMDEDVEVWTEKGFTRIRKLIRHKCEKPIVRVLTHTGVVDCTTDHSLVDFRGNKVSPNDVSVGQKLMHTDFDLSTISKTTRDVLSVKEAYALGSFVASCEKDSDEDGCSSIKFRQLFFNNNREKRVPAFMLAASLNIIRSFMRGFKDTVKSDIFDKSKELCAGLAILAQRVGMKFNINSDVDDDSEFLNISCEIDTTCNADEIKSITPLTDYDADDYVYDLETENHHFHVGPGRLVVHNTDSSMFTLPNHIKEPADCHIWGPKVMEEITGIFPPPLKLEFEKAMRIFCMKKKKYAALLIKPDGTFEKKKLVRGIVLARRDNCEYLRDLYEKVMNDILYHAGPTKCFRIIYEAMIDLVGNRVPVEKLSVVTSLGSNYKQVGYKMAVFAQECAKAERPAQPGDRLAFIIAKNPSSVPEAGSAIKPENLGFKMRALDVWKKNKDGDPIDYFYYISHQFMNPIDQIYSIAFPDVAKALVLDKRTMRYGNCLSDASTGEEGVILPTGTNFITASTPLTLLCEFINSINKANIKLARTGGVSAPELDSSEMASCARMLLDTFEANVG